MPGALSAMAKAVTGDETKTAELMDKMQKGQVKTNDVLLKFSEELMRRASNNGAFDSARQSTGSAQNRFNNAFTRGVEAVSRGGFDQGMMRFFEGATKAIDRLLPLIEKLGAAFRFLMTPVVAVMRVIGGLGDALSDLLDEAGDAQGVIMAIATALGVMLLPFGPLIVGVSALALALDDLFTYLRGGDSLIGDFVASLSPENQAMIIQFQNGLTNLRAEFGKLQEAVDRVMNIFAAQGPEANKNTIFHTVGQQLLMIEESLSRIVRLATALMNLDLKTAGNLLIDQAASSIGQNPFFAPFVKPDPNGNWISKRLYSQQQQSQSNNQDLQDLAGRGMMPNISQANANFLLNQNQPKIAAPGPVFGDIHLQVSGIAGTPEALETAVQRALQNTISSMQARQSENE